MTINEIVKNYIGKKNIKSLSRETLIHFKDYVENNVTTSKDERLSDERVTQYLEEFAKQCRALKLPEEMFVQDSTNAPIVNLINRYIDERKNKQNQNKNNKITINIKKSK